MLRVYTDVCHVLYTLRADIQDTLTESKLEDVTRI